MAIKATERIEKATIISTKDIPFLFKHRFNLFFCLQKIMILKL
jgi:hypothetical protein